MQLLHVCLQLLRCRFKEIALGWHKRYVLNYYTTLRDVSTCLEISPVKQTRQENSKSEPNQAHQIQMSQRSQQKMEHISENEWFGFVPKYVARKKVQSRGCT